MRNMEKYVTICHMTSDLERKRGSMVRKRKEERSKKKPNGGFSFRPVESYVETEVAGFYTVRGVLYDHRNSREHRERVYDYAARFFLMWARNDAYNKRSQQHASLQYGCWDVLDRYDTPFMTMPFSTRCECVTVFYGCCRTNL